VVAQRRDQSRQDDPERDDPVLPQTSRDERDEGWGDERDDRRDERYRRERPPHHE
jgi:hypothetical protein